MAKVTSKLQVTIPKALAERCGIGPGDDIEWSEAAGGIRITPATKARSEPLSVEVRLELFDRATERQKRRQRGRRPPKTSGTQGRGWSRAELYRRGRSR